MKKKLFWAGLLAAIMLSSCSMIPTLPPPESTVLIEATRLTPAPTGTPAEVSVIHATAGSESPTAALPSTSTRQPSLTATFAATQQTEEAPASTPAEVKSATPEATFTPTPFPYGFQDGSPYYMDNFAHPEEGCEWFGVAGQIFDQKGKVVTDVVVKAGGKLGGEPILDSLSMPGAAKIYGPGGYEIVLSHAPAASQGEVWVQLFDLDGQPVSEKRDLTTHDSCQKNLILLNFVRK